jgi:hypothetical protein
MTRKRAHNMMTRGQEEENAAVERVDYIGRGGPYLNEPRPRYFVAGDSDPDRKCPDVAEALGSCPNVGEVRIVFTSLADWQMRAIMGKLAGSNVRTLELYMVPLTHPLSGLFECLPAVRSLRTLDLCSGRMGEGAFAGLAYALPRSEVSTLRLNTDGALVTRPMVDYLAAAISGSASLARLVLKLSGIEQASIDALAAAIADSEVHSLQVWHSARFPAGALRWAAALAQVLPRSRLRALDFSYTHLTIDAIDLLAAALPAGRCLSIDVGGCLFLPDPLRAVQHMAALSVRSAGRLHFLHVSKYCVHGADRAAAKAAIAAIARIAKNRARNDTTLAQRCVHALGPAAPAHLRHCTHAQAAKRQCERHAAKRQRR